MGEWGDTPPTFDRSSDAWGSSQSAFGDEDEGGGDQYVEMIGSQLWVAGTINLGGKDLSAGARTVQTSEIQAMFLGEPPGLW